MVEYYLPSNAKEQLSVPRTKLIQVTHSLARRLSALLTREGISYIAIESRTKSERRIVEKVKARGSHPVADIHGIIFQMEEGFDVSFNAIRADYPTPEVFSWGIETVRDRRDPEIRDKYNPYSDPRFQPIIFNILIPRGARIAEVQLMTPETYRVGLETRRQYVIVQHLKRE